MAIQTPVLATPLPPAPSTNDPDNFDPMADARMEAEGPFGDQVNALALNMFNNATEAQARALQAQQAAADAQSAAAAAAAATAAGKWAPGNYGDGDAVWSPISHFSYRHIGVGASASDPALDAAHWVLQLYALGLGGMVITGSVDLNVTSGGAISVTPATPGLYITLPDTTTLAQGAVAFHAFNAGVYDIGVKNKAGVVLGWIRPGTSSVIGVASNATPAGVWVTSNLHKLGLTALLNVPAISPVINGNPTLKRIGIDGNRTLFLFGALYAVVYDSSIQQWGAPVLVRASANGMTGASGILVSADKVMVASFNGSAQLEVVILSVSGVSIAPNTPATAASAGGYGISEMVAVGAGFAFGTYTPNGLTQVRAITVNGTTPTIGNEAPLSTSRGVLPVLFVSGTVLRAVGLDGGAGGSGNLICTPYTLNGANLAPGTPANVGNGPSVVPPNGLRCFQNGNGNIVVIYAATILRVCVFKLTGATETASDGTAGMLADNGASFDFVQVATTKTALVSTYVGVGVSWNIHTDTNGVSSFGAVDSLAVSNSSVAAVGLTGSAARFAIYNATYNSNALPPTQLQFDCSGSSPVRGNTQSRWNVNMPRAEYGGKAARHFSVISAGSNQYSVGGNSAWDGVFNAGGIQALASLGENSIGGAYGAAANETWLLSGLGSGGLTFGTTIKRIEAAA